MTADDAGDAGDAAGDRDATTSSQIELRRATIDDAEAIAAGLTEAFGIPRSADWVRWRLHEGPFGQAHSYVATHGSRLVGHVAHDPIDAHVGGRRSRVFGSGLLFTDREWRQHGVASLLTDFARAQTPPHDERLSFPVELVRGLMLDRFPDARGDRLDGWVRWRTAGALRRDTARRWVQLASPGAAVLAAGRLAAARRSARLTVHDGLDDAAAHDELVARSLDFAPRITVRSHERLAWRWLRHPDGVRVAHARGPGAATSGYIAWRRHPITDRGQVVDLLAVDVETATALLVRALDDLHASGADVVVCDLLDPRGVSGEALARTGFVKRRSATTVVDFTPDGLRPVHDWYLTLVDTDLA